MSAAEFESLVALFLEGTASADQVARLRAALSASPAGLSPCNPCKPTVSPRAIMPCWACDWGALSVPANC